MPTTYRIIFLCGLAIGCLLWLRSGLNSPLWVDELHTSWVIDGNWSELIERSKAGNQSFVYFALLKIWTSIAGHSLGSLRCPSLLAWIASVVSIAAWLLKSVDTRETTNVQRQEFTAPSSARRAELFYHTLPAVIWCLSILVDRKQYFYAVEARPYAIVQLLNLWSWMLVIQLLRAEKCKAEGNDRPWLGWAWAACASLMVDMHITSGLSLVGQVFVIAMAVGFQFRRNAVWFVSLAIVAVNSLWQLIEHQAVWSRRQQWAAFASDDSLHNLLSFFPFIQVLLPIAVAWAGTVLFQRRLAKMNENASHSIRWEIPVWLLGGSLPIFLAWFLTHQNIAPLMHSRFLITAIMPLYVGCGRLALALNSVTLRWIVVGSVLAWLTMGQADPIQTWKYDRNEHWSIASEELANHFDPSKQSLWCYSGLIEGKNAQLPLPEGMNEYLSYPLRGLYKVQVERQSVAPSALVADRTAWLKQLQRRMQLDGLSQVWIVYRGAADRFERELKSTGLDQFERLHTLQSYGRICTVCIDLARMQEQP